MRISDWSSDGCSSDLEIRASRVLEAVHDAGADGIGDDHEYLGYFVVVDRIVELTEGTPDDEGDAGAPTQAEVDVLASSVERRVGKEWVSTWRYRWSPYH